MPYAWDLCVSYIIVPTVPQHPFAFAYLHDNLIQQKFRREKRSRECSPRPEYRRTTRIAKQIFICRICVCLRLRDNCVFLEWSGMCVCVCESWVVSEFTCCLPAWACVRGLPWLRKHLYLFCLARNSIQVQPYSKPWCERLNGSVSFGFRAVIVVVQRCAHRFCISTLRPETMPETDNCIRVRFGDISANHFVAHNTRSHRLESKTVCD